MNVKSFSRDVTIAFGLLRKGSGARYGGLSAEPGFGRGCRVAYVRENVNAKDSPRFMK